MSPSRQPVRPQTSGPDPKVIIGVVVGVLLLVVAAIVFVSGGDSGDDDVAAGDGTEESQFGIVTVQGDGLPELPDSGQDPAEGMTAPTIVSERAVGQVRVEPTDEGEPMVLVFLAHWCPHCQAELPVLVEMADDGAFDGVRTVAVLTNTSDEAPNYPPSAWLDEGGWTGDRLFDDEAATAGRAYGLSSFPMMVFLDEDGTVVERLSGEQGRAAIEDALAQIT